MKTKSFLFLMSVLLVAGVVCLSCKKDDDNEVVKLSDSIIGGWTTGFHESHMYSTPEDWCFYSQHYEYYSSNGYMAYIFAYFDKDKKFTQYSIYEGPYTVKDNILVQPESFGETLKFDVQKNKFTQFYEDNGETHSRVFTRVSENEIKKYIDAPKNDLIGYWGGSYHSNNENGEVFKKYLIYKQGGKVDELTVYFEDLESQKFIRSTIRHGQWSFDDLVLTEKFPDVSHNFLVSFLGNGFSKNIIDSDDYRLNFGGIRIQWSDIQEYYDKAKEE